MPKDYSYLEGLVFCKLTIIEKILVPECDPPHRLKCLCACGNIHEIRFSHWGKINSCGCYSGDRGSNFYKDGRAKERLFYIWLAMKRRCFNKNCEGYKNYGAKGITICEEWMDYAVFRTWALSHGYLDNLTIDRFPNMDGNYEPSNCRWATQLQQTRNRHNTVHVSYKGISKPLAEWVDIIGEDKGKRIRLRFYRAKRRKTNEEEIFNGYEQILDSYINAHSTVIS